MLPLLIGGLLAYVNGANDVSKGIATLVGGGVTDYRRAIVWGTCWTSVGGLLGALFGVNMLSTFAGLLVAQASPTFSAALAALLGAAVWVLVATRTGLPVSTTHAIVGSLGGVAALAYGVDAVRWRALAGTVLLPLLVSPVAALLLAALVLRATRALRLRVDRLHWLTSGATSVARGMNDAPKIVALVMAAHALAGQARIATPLSFAVVTVAMGAGSLLAGRRVTVVLAEKVTDMGRREGFAANLVTAGLVAAGAFCGLPMSTTHVSSAGILGAGLMRRSLNRRTLRDIVFAWVVTVPAAAALGMGAYLVAGELSP